MLWIAPPAWTETVSELVIFSWLPTNGAIIQSYCRTLMLNITSCGEQEKGINI
jgi:hypothetical protein